MCLSVCGLCTFVTLRYSIIDCGNDQHTKQHNMSIIDALPVTFFLHGLFFSTYYLFFFVFSLLGKLGSLLDTLCLMWWWSWNEEKMMMCINIIAIIFFLVLLIAPVQIESSDYFTLRYTFFLLLTNHVIVLWCGVELLFLQGHCHFSLNKGIIISKHRRFIHTFVNIYL